VPGRELSKPKVSKVSKQHGRPRLGWRDDPCDRSHLSSFICRGSLWQSRSSASGKGDSIFVLADGLVLVSRLQAWGYNRLPENGLNTPKPPTRSLNYSKGAARVKE